MSKINISAINIFTLIVFGFSLISAVTFCITNLIVRNIDIELFTGHAVLIMYVVYIIKMLGLFFYPLFSFILFRMLSNGFKSGIIITRTSYVLLYIVLSIFLIALISYNRDILYILRSYHKIKNILSNISYPYIAFTITIYLIVGIFSLFLPVLASDNPLFELRILSSNFCSKTNLETVLGFILIILLFKFIHYFTFEAHYIAQFAKWAGEFVFYVFDEILIYFGISIMVLYLYVRKRGTVRLTTH